MSNKYVSCRNSVVIKFIPCTGRSELKQVICIFF